MLQAHWLDELFADPKGFPEKLVGSSGFKKAVEMATKAFENAKKDARNIHDFRGPSPEQAARVAFLDSLTS